jgi:hypothetical protein
VSTPIGPSNGGSQSNPNLDIIWHLSDDANEDQMRQIVTEAISNIPEFQRGDQASDTIKEVTTRIQDIHRFIGSGYIHFASKFRTRMCKPSSIL